jgi:hypothetical protein
MIQKTSDGSGQVNGNLPSYLGASESLFNIEHEIECIRNGRRW